MSLIRNFYLQCSTFSFCYKISLCLIKFHQNNLISYMLIVTNIYAAQPTHNLRQLKFPASLVALTQWLFENQQHEKQHKNCSRKANKILSQIIPLVYFTNRRTISVLYHMTGRVEASQARHVNCFLRGTLSINFPLIPLYVFTGSEFSHFLSFSIRKKNFETRIETFPGEKRCRRRRKIYEIKYLNFASFISKPASKGCFIKMETQTQTFFYLLLFSQ